MCPGAPHVQHGRKARLPVAASDCLSVQYMVGCDMHDSGCDGGYIDNAWQFLATRGVTNRAIFVCPSRLRDAPSIPSRWR